MNLYNLQTHKIVDRFVQIATMFAPIVVSTAIQMGFQDQRIGKIVSGIGCISSGVALIGASGIPKRIKSWYGKANDDSQQEGISKKTIRWGTAAIGFAATSYGVYNIISGVMGFYEMQRCQANLEEAKKSLRQCWMTDRLWKEVEEKGAFSIECVDPLLVPGGAGVLIEPRKIYIASSNKDVAKMIDCLLFELNNLDNLEPINRSICDTPIEAYAFGREGQECLSSLRHYLQTKFCMDHKMWPAGPNRFQDFFSGQDIDKGLAKGDVTILSPCLAVQNLSFHTDQHRLNWYTTCDLEGLRIWAKKKLVEWQDAALRDAADGGNVDLLRSLIYQTRVATGAFWRFFENI